VAGLPGRISLAGVPRVAPVVQVGVPVWVGLGLGTLPTIIMALASGHMTTNGMLVKSHFAIDMDWVRYLWETGRTIAAVPSRLLWAPNGVVHGLMILATVLGVATLISGRLRDKQGRRNAALGLAVASAFLAIIAFYGLLMEHIEHHNRYYMPYVPLVVFTMVVGIDGLSQAFKEKKRAAIRRTAAVALVILGIGSVGEWARIYAHNCGDIAKTYLPMARWMRKNIPEGVSVAVHDAGGLPYLGGHKCHDIIGLVSNEFRVPGGGRSDAFAWEKIERLKPGYMIIYPRFFPRLSRLPVFRKVHSVRIHRVTIAGGREKVAYRILWDRLAPGDKLYGTPGADSTRWKLVDTLDPGDDVSEKKHHYEVDHGRIRGPSRFRLHVYRIGGRHLIDGARVYTARESFQMGPVKKNEPVALGVRTHGRGAASLRVTVNGKALEGYWDPGRAARGNKNEAYLEIPSRYVTSKTLRITLEPLEGGEFASYHYFALQPR
jgi:uncharacterized membrane protein YhaH (DUF805 family)